MDDAGAGVVFRLLGPVEIDVDGRRVEIHAAKVRTVLAVLLVHANRVVSRDFLADVLWGDAPPPSAANTLQTYISQLRRALTSHPVPGERHPLLLTRDSGYLLRVARDRSDAARFEDLVDRARTELPPPSIPPASTSRPPASMPPASMPPASMPEVSTRATATLREALAIWRGPALPEFAELDFARPEIARLAEMRLAATEDLVRAELASGRHAAIIGELGALVSATPLRENLTGYLMLSLYRSGRQADALRAYQYLRRALGEELGIDPSPAVAELEMAMLRHDPDLDFAPAPPPSPVSLAPARPPATTSDLDWTDPASTPFVGRRSEYAVLVEACTAPGPGCRAVLVQGDPGIGKTRLVGEAARHAAGAGRLVLYGRGDEHLGDAYRIWARALPRVAVDGDQSAGPLPAGSIPADEADARRLQFFTAASAALASAAGTRLVLVLDDLQWADVPSLLFLRHLLLEAPEFPLTAVVVVRLGPCPAVLDSTMAAVKVRGTARHLELHGLEAGDVAELVEHGGGGGGGDAWLSRSEARQLWADTGGNALFVTEVLRDLARSDRPTATPQPVPDSIRDVARGRMGSLSAATTSLLVAAAVLGTPGSGPVLGKIAGLDGEATVSAIVEGSDARFLVPVSHDPGVFEFAHALLRSAVYDDIPLARRLDLHRRTALVLQSEPGVEGRPAEVARHWTCAGRFGDPAAAIRFRRLAGEAADRDLGYEQAASHYRGALTLIDQYPEHADPVSRCEILLALASTENRSGDVNAAKDACREAAELAHSAGRGDLLASAALEYGGVLPMGSGEVDDPEARRLLRRAGAAVDPQSVQSALVSARIAQLEYWLLPRAERRALCDRAVVVARSAGDATVLATVLLSRYWALNCPDELDERLAVTAELEGLGRADASPELWLQAGKCRLHLLLEMGDLASAVELSGRLADTAARRNNQEHMRLATAFDATVAGLQGRFGEAARLTGEAQALMSRRGHPEHAALAALVQQMPWLWLRGELGQVLPTFRVLVERDPGRSAWRALRSWAAAEAGELDEARDQLAALDVGRFVTREPAVDWWGTLTSCANAALVLDDADTIALVRAALTPYAGRNAVLGQVAFYGAVSHHLGVLAAATGDDIAAVDHLEGALRRHEAMGATPFVALTAVELAAVLSRSGLTRSGLTRPGLTRSGLTRSGAPEVADEMRARAATISDQLGLGYVARRLAVTGPKPVEA